MLDLLLGRETWKMIKGADRAVDMFVTRVFTKNDPSNRQRQAHRLIFPYIISPGPVLGTT